MGDVDFECEIALKLMSQNTFDDKSTLVQAMAWCHEATSNYPSRCWPCSMSLSRVTTLSTFINPHLFSFLSPSKVNKHTAAITQKNYITRHTDLISPLLSSPLLSSPLLSSPLLSSPLLSSPLLFSLISSPSLSSPPSHLLLISFSSHLISSHLISTLLFSSLLSFSLLSSFSSPSRLLLVSFSSLLFSSLLFSSLLFSFLFSTMYLDIVLFTTETTLVQ